MTNTDKSGSVVIETKEAQGLGLKTCHQHLFILLFV